MPSLRTQIIAWSLYDFADTSFSALFISFFYPILIKQYLGGNEFQVGLVMGLSLVAVALLVPFIGAVADAANKRMPLLVISTLLTVVLTSAAGYFGLAAALALGFLARFFNTIDVDLYNSYLIDLAPPERRGKISGVGVGIGYLGAIASLAAAYGVLSYFGFETKTGVQAIFPTVGIFYLIFSLPMFFFVKNGNPAIKTPILQAVSHAWSELKFTVTHLNKIKNLGPFLLASFLYNDAMHTTIIFLSLFATEQVGLTIQQFFGVFAIMSIAAFIGALIFGVLSDRWGPKAILSIILLIWLAVVIGLLMVNNWQMFLIAGSIGGAALGGVWTCNRHMISRLAPPRKIAEIFGFEGLTEKMAGFAGPVGFGYLAYQFGFNAGLIFLLFFLIAGFIILRKYVKE
ncbi:MAG: MFS transporter [Parcubacteria group bacterium]|nr:MFS transporter [Parcubacteria group bacterium]